MLDKYKFESSQKDENRARQLADSRKLAENLKLLTVGTDKTP